MEIRKENTGFLYPNKEKKGKQPDYYGYANIDGKQRELAIWVNYEDDEVKNLSMTFKEPYKKSASAGGGDGELKPKPKPKI